MGGVEGPEDLLKPTICREEDLRLMDIALRALPILLEERGFSPDMDEPEPFRHMVRLSTGEETMQVLVRYKPVASFDFELKPFDVNSIFQHPVLPPPMPPPPPPPPPPSPPGVLDWEEDGLRAGGIDMASILSIEEHESSRRGASLATEMESALETLHTQEERGRAALDKALDQLDRDTQEVPDPNPSSMDAKDAAIEHVGPLPRAV